MEILCLRQQHADLFRDTENLRKAEATILVAWGANRDERNIPKVFDTREGPKRPSAHSFCDGFFQLRLNDRAFRIVDGINFVHIEVDPSDVMSVLCLAGGDDRADITQTKNDNLHE
jgi:hypothetical protein